MWKESVEAEESEMRRKQGAKRRTSFLEKTGMLHTHEQRQVNATIQKCQNSREAKTDKYSQEITIYYYKYEKYMKLYSKKLPLHRVIIITLPFASSLLKSPYRNYPH